jgi:hypothetical protein
MGIALAVLVLVAISGGFVALLGLPLVFIWLGYCIYKEPWEEEAPETIPSAETSAGKREVAAEALPTPPRTMAAGRRRPLP